MTRKCIQCEEPTYSTSGYCRQHQSEYMRKRYREQVALKAADLVIKQTRYRYLEEDALAGLEALAESGTVEPHLLDGFTKDVHLLLRFTANLIGVESDVDGD